MWDEPKRLANLSKHGLDFADFEQGFSWEDFLVIPTRPSRITERGRRILIGTLNDALIVPPSFPRSDRRPCPLVSLRPAGKKERRRYGQDA